ncbi:hypothetical protein ACFC09_35885 [Streptomyces sp. NPDC056161]|uniref:hypothetical protein n=1 Tax=Streptomyces sp. NPDC056161 TaxID=3345732 RepID=UPI0035E1A1BF
MSDIDLPDTLLAAEREAWAAIQAGSLTVEQAAAVHEGMLAFAEQAGRSRLEVEEVLKKAVRHPEG